MVKIDVVEARLRALNEYLALLDSSRTLSLDDFRAFAGYVVDYLKRVGAM